MITKPIKIIVYNKDSKFIESFLEIRPLTRNDYFTDFNIKLIPDYKLLKLFDELSKNEIMYEYVTK